jgi:hypothetical protein
MKTRRRGKRTVLRVLVLPERLIVTLVVLPVSTAVNHDEKVSKCQHRRKKIKKKGTATATAMVT